MTMQLHCTMKANVHCTYSIENCVAYGVTTKSPRLKIVTDGLHLKVHKRENFLGSDFEYSTFS